VSSIWRQVFHFKTAWLIGLALAALPLLGAFNARLAVSRQLLEEEARLQRAIDYERSREQLLDQYEQHAKTDVYVEAWARRARMAKPGEIAVVPVMPSDAEEGIESSDTGRLPRDHVFEWWAVFFAGLP
jgi:hypothetical protein